MRDSLYGRGTTDMKGFLACVLSTVARIDASRLVRPLHIALTHDEEVGCFGAKTLIRHLPPARAIIVGEPTAMRIADRHKGAVAQTIRIKGLSAHSGLPQNGVNAIEHAVQIAGCIADIAQDLIETGGDDDTMQPGYSSIQLAAIAGGGATNVIPDHCDLVWQLRCLPGQSPDAVVEQIKAAARTVEARMRNRDRSCTITFEPMYDVPPLNRTADNPATAICRHLLGPQETIGVNFATEAGLYQRAGYAVVVCGPGNMAQGHTDNEYIQMTELGKCENFLAGLVDELSQREWGA
ncbi:hypothetical protein GCM10011505_50910 [Tistrella bauzanensis]|uniref:Peptidase M20 dimerisation domain-containing protein n=1 Tax=Tistrella bauzanensis TaxID=657419 RepID=A0ABQ1JE98_9PROT|nr:M20/M25/M40 family metallo-hydrolase [Tistrella bauzanensis]GGB64262.1 hypothetical protein GCM10011505_50910 [Tistrella bauzanensis]